MSLNKKTVLNQFLSSTIWMWLVTSISVRFLEVLNVFIRLWDPFSVPNDFFRIFADIDMLELRLTGLTFRVIQNLESHSKIVWENQSYYILSQKISKRNLPCSFIRPFSFLPKNEWNNFVFFKGTRTRLFVYLRIWVLTFT